MWKHKRVGYESKNLHDAFTASLYTEHYGILNQAINLFRIQKIALDKLV